MKSWTYSFRSSVAVLAACGLGLLTLGACPPPGSGAQGVADWAAANCDGGQCTNPAVTCNNEFSIELISVERDGSLVTFTYETCELFPTNDLSHFIVGLGQIGCLGDGQTLQDLVVSATLNGEPATLVLGLDPSTQIVGMKMDDGGLDGCNTISFTLDESALEAGFGIGVDCAIAATKAGNQDITRSNRASPGYACIAGPACIVVLEGCTHGYWRQEHHHDSWAPTGFLPNDTLDQYFTFPLSIPLGDTTLDAAMDFGGGETLVEKAQLLMVQAVPALLNAAHPDVFYPRTVGDVIDDVNAALASEDPQIIEALKDALDADNNLGCPLD